MQVQIAEKFQPLFKPKRMKIFFGGRGGAKSWGFAQALAIIAAQEPKRVLCAREFQNSIDDSVLTLLSDRMTACGLDSFYDVQATAIYGQNGSEFSFKGLARNIMSIKSVEGTDIVWIEEANTITQKTLDVLIPTIRKPGSEIWMSLNPHDETDPCYKNYISPHIKEILKNGYYEDDYIYVCMVNHEDNPWFPEELRIEMEKCKAENYKKYLHVWRGECNADYEDSIIEPEWVEAAIDAHKKLGFEGRGERVVGFDPADSGKDSKALAFRHGAVVHDVLQWDTGDLETAIGKAFDYAFENRADDLVYDSIGVGAGVKVGLEERVGSRNLAVSGFGAADGVDFPKKKYKGDRLNKDTFRNKRAQYWWLLRDRFEKTYRAVEKGEYIDPEELISLSSDIEDLGQLKSELVRQQRKRTSGSRLIQLVSKEDMRKDGIPSPNMADALIMCFANPVTEKEEDYVYIPSLNSKW
jgi:phage terminase large subunit